LIAIDRNTLDRTIRPSGRLYARIAKANGLLKSLDSGA